MKVTLSTETLASIHSLGIGVSKDDIAPVITQIAITREGDSLRAMTTDRYTVLAGRYSGAEFDQWAEDETILVDPKALKNVLDIKKADKYDALPVDIVKDEDTGWVTAVINRATSVHLGSTPGNFPPVMKLFPRDTEANGAPVMALRPDFLAKLAKVLPPEARPARERVWNFEFRTSPESSKPQPVYARYSAGDGYELEALIQPNIIR
jgi:hypothetical protein